MAVISEIKSGNYFEVMHDGGRKKCVISRVLDNPYYIVSLADGNRMVVRNTELLPIAITEGWLQQLGYSPGEIAEHWIHTSGNSSVLQYHNADKSAVLIDAAAQLKQAPCSYIHQLQNAYCDLHGSQLLEPGG
ncbi:MAG: hypothetical protein U0V74_13705 [Chitinophagales bacterium]